ncbi:MAG: hypothetical protein RJA70_343 [Pseudomonadota bacterium]|jgi:hypothetical protein
MTDKTPSDNGTEPQSDRDAAESQRDSLDDGELRHLMRQAFKVEDAAEAPDVLSGIQKRLREGSSGKFYSDAWSTSRQPPFATYFITSLMMLAVIAVIYAILTPVVGEPISLPRESPPVQVIQRR